MQYKLRTALAFLLLSSLLSTAVLTAQSPDAAPAPQATPAQGDQAPAKDQAVYDSSTVVRATTRLVLVDVIATDKNGEPVTNLTTDDFKVLENGKPQTVKVFSFQRPETAPQNLPPLPPNVFTNVPRHKYNGALNVILMDGINTSFENVAAMRGKTLDFLRKLSHDEPVAIYGLNQKLELLQDFTAGVAPLEKTTKQSQPPETEGTFAASKFRDVPESENKVLRFAAWYPQPQVQCLSVEVTIKALHWIARSLSGYPGRKNLIWVSDGFPFDIYTQPSQFTNTCLSRYTTELTETMQTILENQIAIYPVVVGGLENHILDPGSTPEGGLVTGPAFAAITAAHVQQQANQRTLINDIAHKTGGEAYTGRNDLDMAIRSSIDDGSTYYTLGYYPDNKNWNDAFRTITVKVDREAIQLRHRTGYFATSASTVADHSEKSRGHSMSEALALEAPTASSVLFEATYVQPSPQTKNQAVVKFAIDPRGLSFQKPDELEHASVDCVVKVYSLKGAIVNTSSSTMNAKLSPETFSKVMQTSFPCQQNLSLAPGTYMLRLSVIDNNTGLLGTAAGKITVF